MATFINGLQLYQKMPVFYGGGLLAPTYVDEWHIAGAEIRAQLLPNLDAIANKPFYVLILGETGTGKELAAHHIHQKSQRKNKNFLTINIAAVTDTVFESELFGHERGSFTGAIGRRKGLFAEADQGTIFLDEIGDLKPSAQAALLRFLQSGEIRKVGSNTVEVVDTRIISATNYDLERLIEVGKFRTDLYHRLDQLSVRTIPLRQSRSDIPYLLGYFIDKYKEWFGEGMIRATVPASLTRLICEFEWPGNVRQLENHVKRYATTEDPNELVPRDYKDFVRFMQANLEGYSLTTMLRVVAVNYIDAALKLWKNESDDGVGEILGIGDSELDAWTRNRERFNELKRPLYVYPGLRNLLTKYAKEKLPISYVLTRFARAFTGAMLESQVQYPDDPRAFEDRHLFATPNLEKVFPQLRAPCPLDFLQLVMDGEKEIRLSNVPYMARN